MRSKCAPLRPLTSISTGRASPAYGYAGSYGTSQQGVLVRVAPATKMADAQVEYKRADLQSYEARNGASFAQWFKYKFSFPSMYRRLKSTRNRGVNSERKFEAKAGNAPEVKMALRF